MEDGVGKVLLTGVTGFVGGRLLPHLQGRAIQTRCLVRSPGRVAGRLQGPHVELAAGDLLDRGSLARALEGQDAAVYLVHSMGGRSVVHYMDYIERDMQAAENFMWAAERTGLRRIIYLGGLGEMGDNLAPHLASRQKVGEILQSGTVKTTVLRAANIIGAGGAPFEMLRYLVERLPVMLCPRWIDTPGEPIAVQNVVEYIAGCLTIPETAGGNFDIGGPDIITYRQLMLIYARVRGLKRLVFSVPVLTPYLSSFWINLMTPVPAGVVMPLVEGLKNKVVCRDHRIRELVPLRLITMQEAICEALAESSGGPGKLPSRQACFLH
ncbi:MAG: NAD(P)H-binding protein [Syntrophobacteraceae bacterium]|jgi:uncharacterized protein YbjT (DUF2867 family)|nr:NAD(P)H-binding protein [Syntrophobacteraceae bacterium]